VALASTALLLALAVPAAAAPRPMTAPPGAAAQGPALSAAQRLNDAAWRPVARASERASQDWLERTLERTLASADGKAGPAKWRFSLKVDDVDSRVDLSQPPGFRDMGPAGFTIGFPRTGTWRVGAAATLKGRAKVTIGGETIFSWSPSARLSLSLPRFRASVGGRFGADLNSPSLTGGAMSAEGGFEGGGALPESSPINFEPAAENGNPGVAGQVNIPLRLPGLKARLKGEMRAILEPSEPIDDLGFEVPDGPFGVRGKDLRNVFNLLLPFQELRITLKGRLHVKLERVGERKVPFELNFGVPILSAQGVNELLLALRAFNGLGPSFGTGGAPTPAPATDLNGRLGAAAADLEQRIVPHIPNGTVFSIDGPPARPGAKPATAYSAFRDSAIWTGHYLAAEALRYSVTRSPQALERVRAVMDGVRRLFDVTQDVYRVDGKRRPVPGHFRPNQVFARAVLPSTSPVQAKELEEAKCVYENPDGGWELRAGRQSKGTFELFELAERARNRLPAAERAGATIKPLGTVWRGFGCGSVNAAISRDQYAGLFLGLSFVHRLVDDQQLRQTAAGLLDNALGFLAGNDFQIIVPPDVRGQNYWFSWDKILAMLRVGAEVRPERWNETWLGAAPALPTAWIPGFFSGLDPLHQHYKFNLAHASFLAPLLLEQNDGLRPGFEFARDVTNLPVRHYKNAWYTVAEILGEAPGNRRAAAEVAAASNPAITKAQEIRTLLGQWLTRRDAIAGPNNLPLGRVPDPGFLAALWPADVTRYRKLDLGVACFARYALPPDKRIGRGMEFLWQRHPFDVGMKSENCLPAPRGSATPASTIAQAGAPTPDREGPGVDFLLPYWAGVYAGIIPPPPPG
jgi:hypothetical protein